MMDHSPPGEKYFEADLESGGTCNEDESSKNPGSGAKNLPTLLFAEARGGFVDGATKGENGVNVCSSTASNGVSTENVKINKDVKVEGSENLNSVEKKTGKEKRKKSSNKKPPKPPQPPRGPSLDAADKKLIRELSELALLKRAKIDRMKALKKMKATKFISLSGNLWALVFTFVFCLVILFQVLSSRTSRSTDSESVGMEGSLISVQYYGNPSPNDLHGPASDSVDQVTDSDPQVRPRRFNR